MSKIPFRDRVTYSTPPCNPISEAVVNIPVLAETKIWREKFYHLETPNDAAGNPHVGKGDDLSFILVFGNDGELPCPASPPNPDVIPPYAGNPSVEDTLEIQAPINLKLMSLCIGDEYELWVVGENGIPLTTPYKVERCHVFQSGVYTLQLRKKVDDGPATPYFEIPCHFICCIAMLFQLEFPGCPTCPSDCQGRPIINGSFENDLFGWTPSVPSGGSVSTVTSHVVNPAFTYFPVEGNYFALLSVSERDTTTSISQTISVCPGDKLEGYAFLDKQGDTIARVTLYIDGLILASYNDNSPGWEYWSYTFTQAGTHVLTFEVTKESNDGNPSYFGLDAIKIV